MHSFVYQLRPTNKIWSFLDHSLNTVWCHLVCLFEYSPRKYAYVITRMCKRIVFCDLDNRAWAESSRSKFCSKDKQPYRNPCPQFHTRERKLLTDFRKVPLLPLYSRLLCNLLPRLCSAFRPLSTLIHKLFSLSSARNNQTTPVWASSFSGLSRSVRRSPRNHRIYGSFQRITLSGSREWLTLSLDRTLRVLQIKRTLEFTCFLR